MSLIRKSKEEFKKTHRVDQSRRRADGKISVTYSSRSDEAKEFSNPLTIVIKDFGGALRSLFCFLTGVNGPQD